MKNTKEHKCYKIEIGVTMFLVGMALQWAIILFGIRGALPHVYWSVTHPDEVKWSMDRYELIQKASHVLYFEDEMKGVTIVKPQPLQ